MPWTVTPSELVVVKWTDDDSSAEHKDLLELTLGDGSRMFVRKSSCDHHQVLDEQLLPPLFERYATDIVNRVLACTGATKIRIDHVFAQCADKTMSLETYVFHRVCHEPLVSAAIEPGPNARWRQLNIGDRVRVQIAPYAQDWHLPFDIQDWVADSEIVHIRPVTRYEALVNFIAYPSPDQAWPKVESDSKV